MGLFKLEHAGESIHVLCSKTYAVKNNNLEKVSCKGVSKKGLSNAVQIFKDVLSNQKSKSGKISGIVSRNNEVVTYNHERKGFSYFYCKRTVLDCGIRAEPLDLVLTPWVGYNIYFFGDKETEVLSNMYLVNICYENKQFNSVEHTFLYQLALHHNQQKLLLFLEKSNFNSYLVKLELQKITERVDWIQKGLTIIWKLLLQKTEKCSTFCLKLIETNPKEIVYCNKADQYFGCGKKMEIAEY